MHRLLKRQVKQVFGKEFNINEFDTKTLELLEMVTETYHNFDDEKKFLNHTVKKNKIELDEMYNNMLSNSRLAAIGEMMENITHQWKQPLSIILNLISLLKLDIKDNKDLQIIEEQTRYLNNTILDFKNFSSHAEDEKISFELKKSIEETIGIFNFQSQAHNISIVKNLEKNLHIQGHIGKFNQVLLVLLSNAKDAFLNNDSTDRTIEIKSETIGKDIVISIQDNAGGIPLKNINKIFEPYFTTKFKDKGTGIGLSMTYNIIKKMNGTIEVKNINHGALFTIKFPNRHKGIK